MDAETIININKWLDWYNHTNLDTPEETKALLDAANEIFAALSEESNAKADNKLNEMEGE